MPTIYNTTDSPVDLDAAGRMLAGRERATVKSVKSEPLAAHIEAGRVVVIDHTPTTEGANNGDPIDQEA